VKTVGTKVDGRKLFHVGVSVHAFTATGVNKLSLSACITGVVVSAAHDRPTSRIKFPGQQMIAP